MALGFSHLHLSGTRLRSCAPGTAGTGESESMSSVSRESLSGIRNKLMAHLLALDEDKQEKPKKWTPSLQGLKITDLFAGITLTQNFMWLVLFVGFFAWLFVIYWVRHNEPLANQVLGSPNTSPKAHEDRALVAGIKKVLPVRTSAKTGDFYVPYNDSFGTNSSGQTTFAAPHATDAEASASPYGPVHHPYNPTGHPWITPPSTYSPYMAHPYATSPVQSMHPILPQTLPSRGNYMVGVQTHSGTKVKTIVNQ